MSQLSELLHTKRTDKGAAVKRIQAACADVPGITNTANGVQYRQEALPSTLFAELTASEGPGDDGRPELSYSVWQNGYSLSYRKLSEALEKFAEAIYNFEEES